MLKRQQSHVTCVCAVLHDICVPQLRPVCAQVCACMQYTQHLEMKSYTARRTQLLPSVLDCLLEELKPLLASSVSDTWQLLAVDTALSHAAVTGTCRHQQQLPSKLRFIAVVKHEQQEYQPRHPSSQIAQHGHIGKISTSSTAGMHQKQDGQQHPTQSRHKNDVNIADSRRGFISICFIHQSWTMLW